MDFIKEEHILEEEKEKILTEKVFLQKQLKKMESFLKLRREIMRSKQTFKISCLISVFVIILFFFMNYLTDLSVVQSLLFQLSFLCMSMTILNGIDLFSLETIKKWDYSKWSNFKEDELEIQKEILEENYQKIEKKSMVY